MCIGTFRFCVMSESGLFTYFINYDSNQIVFYEAFNKDTHLQTLLNKEEIRT